MESYGAFLASKRRLVTESGFDVSNEDINPKLFDWQRDIVKWACRRGKAALFEDCGLGKTVQQLEWANLVCRHVGPTASVIILCPLAVGHQTIREAGVFNIGTEVRMAECAADVKPGINVTNYEKLHLFDASVFDGVVLDESSILKNYTGKIKQKIIDDFHSTKYKMACTATPAPNDRLELGNHAEFLSVMPSNEMIARWFINDTMKSGGYRLRKHATRDFWSWVASWAVALSSPLDIGHDDSDFNIPPLNIIEHIVEARVPAGHLFHPGTQKVSAIQVHREKRYALDERADMVASLVNSNDEAWAVWCDTDYEADVLTKRIPDAVEVRGSHQNKTKVDRLLGFSDGSIRVMITKPQIGGYGLNWQHCHNTTWFAGYSFEKFYQAIRRLWRFGQKHAVDCHVVMSEAEQSIADVVKRKQNEHSEMQSEMCLAMRDAQIAGVRGKNLKLSKYNPSTKIELPEFMI